jgi:hypothetical protein
MGNRLLWILFAVAMFILIVMHGYIYFNHRSEGFVDAEPAESAPNLKACPSSLRKFYTSNSVDCCEGSVISGKCKGKPACTLSAKSGDLPRCVDWLSTYSINKGVSMCPPSMPIYFENDNGAFCTAGTLRLDTRGTVDEAAAKCAIEGDIQKRLDNPDSCYNIRRLDEMKLPPDINIIKKEILVKKTKGKIFVVPMLMYATKSEPNHYKICADRTSMENGMDYETPTWRSDPAIVKRINDQVCI